LQTFLIAKIWHIAQIFPISKEHVRQLATAIVWFIWKGTIFRVPMSTLQRRREDGGLELLRKPPNVLRIPRTFEYLRIYAIEWAYLDPRRQQETLRHFKRQVYGTLRSMATTATPPREVCVTQIQTGIDWGKVWNNLHSIPTSEGARSAWYAVLHDLLPTNT